MKYWRPPELEPIAKPEDRRTDRRDLITLIAVGVIGCLISVSLTTLLPGPWVDGGAIQPIRRSLSATADTCRLNLRPRLSPIPAGPVVAHSTDLSAAVILPGPHRVGSVGMSPGVAMLVPSPGPSVTVRRPPVTAMRPRTTNTPNTSLLGPAKNSYRALQSGRTVGAPANFHSCRRYCARSPSDLARGRTCRRPRLRNCRCGIWRAHRVSHR